MARKAKSKVPFGTYHPLAIAAAAGGFDQAKPHPVISTKAEGRAEKSKRKGYIDGSKN